MKVPNPVLPGFHPDPCVIRVGDDYYLVTSTFEWWPAVPIYHSTDLANWRLLGHAVTRNSQLELRGCPDSAGVWAPALSYHAGLFYLVYTDVKNARGTHKDLANYLITAPSPAGPWSDPVYLNGSGFDPSFFHDDDGRTWLLNMLWDPRPDRHHFAGILLQEYDRSGCRLLGAPINIFKGSEDLRRTEGPHLLQRNGYYYLITAEGGSGWTHAVTVARSREIAGPYELSPHHPMLTSAHEPGNRLQKAGHGNLVESSDGSWYLAHLCSRPVGPHRRCILGRETAIQNVLWTVSGWPVMAHGGNAPRDFYEAPAHRLTTGDEGYSDRFLDANLTPVWQTLRQPADESWLSLNERTGFLRLKGRESLDSLFDQSLVGLRVQHHHCNIEVTVDAAPASFLQMAGLALFYNTACYYYLAVSRDEALGRSLRLLARDANVPREILPTAIPLPPEGPIRLRAELRGAGLRFYFQNEAAWTPVGPELDATILSDDYPPSKQIGFAFTGLFVALCAQDLGGGRAAADFSDFVYASEVADTVSAATGSLPGQ